MLIYLLKSSACLAVFLVFYKVALERTSAHQFKRFYLLASLPLSFGIPLITFVEYVEPLPVYDYSVTEFLYTQEATSPIEKPPIDYWPFILWSIYGFGVLVFTLKFIINLNRLRLKISTNERKKTRNSIRVLIEDLKVPHTFFRYIFLNKLNYHCGSIPPEVIRHEEAHAVQKHSVDILLVEIMQIVFWFNPIFYWLKRDIKLNHEFLADASVLKQGALTSDYQHIILDFASKQPAEAALVNAINYSSIKKRFTVMKTPTSKRKLWLRTLLILPVVTQSIYGFSEKKTVLKDTQTIDDSIVGKVKRELVKAGDYQINYVDSTQASEKQMMEYNAWAKKLNAQLKKAENGKAEYPIIKKKDVQKYIDIYTIMSDEQRRHAEPMPVPPPPPAPPKPNPMNDLKEKRAKGYPHPQNVDAPSPPPPAPNSNLEEVIVEGSTTPSAKNNVPSTPPPPKSAYGFVESLKDDSNSYYYNGKKVSYEEVLKIVKKEPNINMSTNINDHQGTVKFWSVD